MSDNKSTALTYIPVNILNYIIKKYNLNIKKEEIKQKDNKIHFKDFYDIINKYNIDEDKMMEDSYLKSLLTKFSFSTIKSIKNIGTETAYDIEVENNHNYVTDGNTVVSNCIYQEQIMAMAQTLAGYSLGEADILRRAIGKKKKAVIQEQRAIFIEKAEKLGNDPEVIGDIYDKTIIPAAEYSFNKCLTGDTRILTNYGEYITINELRNKEYKEIGVKSLDEATLQFSDDKIVDIHVNGIKDVYEITLKNGLKLKSTDNHNFLTAEGWKELKNIKVGGKIAVPYHYYKNDIVNNISTEVISPDDLFISKEIFSLNKEDIGNLIGNIWSGKTFSSKNLSFVNDLQLLLINLGIYTSISKENDIYVLSIKGELSLNNFNRYVSKNNDYKINISNKDRIGEIYYEEIEKIEYFGKEETFDLEIENNHNFIANGIITHNSHAACYAFISYQTAWLKTYYPVEFAIGNMMTADGENLDRVAATYEDMVLDNITLLPLDINKSDLNYTYVDNKTIRMGLLSVKGVGLGKIEAIMKERKDNGDFKDFNDFIRRCKNTLDKSTIESFLMTGMFDEYIDMATGLHNIKNILAWMKGNKKVEQNMSLFDMFDEESKNDDINDIIEYQAPDRPFNNLEKAEAEFSVIGIYLRYHPLSGLQRYIKSGIEKNSQLIYTKENNTFMSRDKKKVYLLAQIKKIFIKKNEAKRNVSDFTLIGTDYILKGKMDAVLTNKHELDLKKKEGYFVEIEGNFNANGYGKSITVTNIKFIEPIEYINNMIDRGYYLEKENLSFINNILYKNQKIPPFINMYLSIYDKYLTDDKYKEKLSNKYLPELKTFLEKEKYGNFKIFLKDTNNNLKDTGFCVEDFGRVQNFLKKQAKWCNLDFSLEGKK